MLTQLHSPAGIIHPQNFQAQGNSLYSTFLWY
jgi:hypothetical protein